MNENDVLIDGPLPSVPSNEKMGEMIEKFTEMETKEGKIYEARNVSVSIDSNSSDVELYKCNFSNVLKWRIKIDLQFLGTNNNCNEITPKQKELLDKLVKFRENHRLYTKPFVPLKDNSNVVNNCLDNFKSLWRMLSKLKPGHPLYLPPIYDQSAGVNAILQQFVRSLIYRELQSDITNDSGNMILSGVEGTGKTTLAYCMVIATAVCCPTYMLIYYDCKTFNGIPPPLGRLILELEQRINENYFDELFGVLEIKNTRKPSFMECSKALFKLYKQIFNVSLRIGFVFDEVQVLYLGKHYALLGDMEQFARSLAAAMIVLTGSSSSLVTELLHNKPGGVNFNRSLCTAYPVQALRTVQELHEYICRRYPTCKHLSNAELSKMLYLTGGIGRWIHKSVSEKCEFKGDIVSKRKEEFMFLFKKADEYLFVIIGILCVEWEKDNLMQPLYSYWQDDTQELEFSTCPSVHESIVNNALFALGIHDASQRIDKFVDQSVLYLHVKIDGSRHIGLALPQLLEFVWKDNHQSGEDLARVGGMYCNMYSKVIGINAGTAFEQLIRPRLHKFKGTTTTTWKGGDPTGATLSVCNTGVYLVSRTGAQKCVNKKPVNSISELTSHLYAWEEDIGIDGIQFHESIDNTDVVFDVWQSKLSCVDMSMGGGALETYRKKFKNDKSVTHFDDTYLASILVNAEVGIATLLKHLTSAFPTVKFRAGTLLVTTTKQGGCGISLMNNIKNQISLSDEVMGVVKLDKSVVSEESIKVHFEYGDHWVQTVLVDFVQYLRQPSVSTSVSTVRPRCVIC